MTRTPDPTTIPIQDHEGPVDPRPAWERIACTWLQREVDGGQPVTAAQLAAEVSVAPAFAGDLLQVLRGQQQRDPDTDPAARPVGQRPAHRPVRHAGAAWRPAAQPGHRRR
jgi:hypothetical protein